MKKDKLKVLIATATMLTISTVSTVPSIVYAAESNKQNIIIEDSIPLNEEAQKNVEGNMETLDNYNGGIITEEVNVTSDVELINAIENPYVKVINLKSDIIITSAGINQSYEVYGDKKINGNNFEISTSAEDGAYQSYVSMKVNNTLNLENVSLRYIGFSSYSGNLIGKNITTYESSIVGNVTLDQVNMTNGALDGKVKVSNGKLNKTMLNPINGALSLTNVEVDALSNGICANSSQVYLENVKIKNSQWTALELQSGSSAVLKGEIVFENVGSEAAILLQKGEKGNTKLTIEGTIHQIGDNYTVKAEKEEAGYTVVEDLNGILTKGVDKSGNSFYNTNSREGQAPELPNESLESIVEVKTGEDFIAAIENPNVDILNIKADITLPNTYNGMSASHEIFKDKKIVGNNFKITTENNRYVGITVNSTLIIEDLNLEYMSFSSYSGSVTGKNITTYESVMVGNISLDKVNMTNGALDGRVTVSNGKLNKTMINPINGALSLTNVEVDALSYGICAHDSQVYLENVKIKNSQWAALEIQAGSTAVLKGEIVFENIGDEAAILLKQSDGGNSKLTIEGTIHQIGDKYTIKAEKEEAGFTIVEDLNGILTKGVDKQGNSYFNTNSREGQEPELPNESLEDVVEVKSGEDFIAAIENPNVHTLDIKSDIVLNNTSNSMNQSYEVLNDKKIIGNGFKISTGGRYAAIEVRSTLEIKDTQLNNVGFNGYYGKIIGEDLNCYETGFTGNVTLDSVTMVKGGVEGALKISKGKLKNTMVSVSYGNIDFNEVEIDGGTTFGIWANSVDVKLKDVKIKNTAGNGLELTGSSKAVLEGDIVFENIGGTTAIELKSSEYGTPKLTVNGEIYQSGDNYTIKSDKEIIGLTEVIVDEKAFDFGTDFRGNTYYNTELRDGKAPEITKAVYPIKTQSKRIVGEAEPNTRVKAEIISSKNRNMSNQLGEATVNGKGIYKIELESELPVGERIIITSMNNDGKVVGSIEGIVEEGKDSIDDSYFDDSVVEEVNTAPKINVSNEIKLYIGDKFQPLKYASATDSEDGDISEGLSIKKHNMPLDDKGQVSKAGNYNIFYQVKDSKGLLTTKVVNVTVSEFRTGWVKEAGKWYYFNESGEMHKGWLNLGGTWYYLKDNGEMATGWLKLGETWYYLQPGGQMATGWLNLSGTWYYLQPGGQMATGWLNLSGTWYYLQPGGQMATGWQRVNGKWYYMNIYGAMETGWVRVNSSWYYLNAYGEMVTGWAYINNNWYYMYLSGVMATNTVINGWKIDAYGIARQ